WRKQNRVQGHGKTTHQGAAAVKMAESLVSLGKLTSKQLTYRPPEQKAIRGYGAHFQAENLV
ncbi:MAG: hypothetical protein ACO4AJ_04855, partial [Prochlorothrix sp.]